MPGGKLRPFAKDSRPGGAVERMASSRALQRVHSCGSTGARVSQASLSLTMRRTPSGVTRSGPTQTLPSNNEIACFYATYNDGYTGGGASGGKNLERYGRRYLALVQEHAAKSGRLIDVGSSNNPFPNLAATSGFETTVMDFVWPRALSREVRLAANNINEPESVEVGRNSFDVVTCWAVLEHLPDPQLSASVLAGLCRPGGTLLLSTPEIGTALTRYSIGRSPWFYPPEHLCLLSPAAVTKMFEPLGCVMQTMGRLELNPLRYAARYGVGLAKAALGLPLKVLGPRLWRRLRDSRLHAFQGISFLVLKKASR